MSKANVKPKPKVFRGYSYSLYNRYRYMLRQDWNNLKEIYYILLDPWTALGEMFSWYRYRGLAIFFSPVILSFKILIVWPFVFFYKIAILPVRYSFVLWHFLFLDVIFPVLKERGFALEGKRNKRRRKFYYFLYSVYRFFAWGEMIIVNYCGIILIIPALSYFWNDGLANYIESKHDIIVKIFSVILDFVFKIIYAWDRWWDYGVTWLDPWSYHKTRYYLSAAYRRRVLYFLRIGWFNIKLFWVHHAYVVYFILWINYQAFSWRLRELAIYYLPAWVKFRLVQLAYKYYWRDFSLLLAVRLEQLYFVLRVISTFVLSVYASFVYGILSYPERLLLFCLRFVHNYFWSKEWVWRPATKKSRGRWKRWTEYTLPKSPGAKGKV